MGVTIGVLIYAFVPLAGLVLFIVRQGLNSILAMPHLLWWFIGGSILGVWGLHLLFQLGKRCFSGLPEPRLASRSHGHLSEVRRSLSSAELETYSQEKIKQLLTTLTINLISLRLDISEEEARKLYFRGDWTEDETVKAYFYRERGPLKKRKLLLRWLIKSEKPMFLKETYAVLNRLSHYSHSPDGGKFDHPNDSDKPGL